MQLSSAKHGTATSRNHDLLPGCHSTPYYTSTMNQTPLLHCTVQLPRTNSQQWPPRNSDKHDTNYYVAHVRYELMTILLSRLALLLDVPFQTHTAAGAGLARASAILLLCLTRLPRRLWSFLYRPCYDVPSHAQLGAAGKTVACRSPVRRKRQQAPSHVPNGKRYALFRALGTSSNDSF